MPGPLTVARNSRGRVICYEQTDLYTVATGASPGLQMPLVDSDLAPRQGLFDSPVINGTRMATEPFLDPLDIAGGYSIQPDPIGIGWPLKWMFGPPTTTGAGPYNHVFKVTAGATLLATTVEKILADIAQVWRFIGVRWNGLSFDVSRGGVLTMPFSLLGYDITEAATQLDGTPYTPAVVAFRVPAVTMSEGGVAFALAQRFAMDLGNNIEGIPVLGNGGKMYDFVEGLVRPTGTLTMLLANRGVYDKAKAGTESSLSITFPAADSVSSLQFTIPEVKYELHGPAIRGGVGPIPVDVAWRGFYGNDAGNSVVIITLINNQVSYAAAIPA
jgi:Phage tail tube protein